MEDFYVVNIFLVLLVGGFGYYLKKKMENLATKEDVGDITRKVESVKADIEQSSRIQETKYKLKYDACFEALDFIDAHFSHLFQAEVPQPTKQYFSIERARGCHNKLILSCENNEIVDLFSKIIFGSKMKESPTDLLNEFRNKIRKELEFKEITNLDRERAWIGSINCEKKDKLL